MTTAFFDPVGTWLWYGLSDLYFGFRNQKNDVYRYGTFSYIMAAEKHMKAVLIDSKKQDFEHLSSNLEQKEAVNRIAKGYSHNFKIMADEIDAIYQLNKKSSFLITQYYGYSTESLINAMFEGYMETRYPTVKSSSRHFPSEKYTNIYHDPLGSSFLTDFSEVICRQCWNYLAEIGFDASTIIQRFDSNFDKSSDYDRFRKTYVVQLAGSTA